MKFVLLLAFASSLCLSSAIKLPLLCAEDAVVNTGMKDKKFTDGIVQCLMDEKPCETDIERKIKVIAPGVFQGTCVHPCTRCMQKQARKAILFMQNKYPKQFGEMILRHGGARGRK